MKRSWLLACTGAITAGAALTAFLILPNTSSLRAQNDGQARPEEPATTQLPIGEVKLFSSGVGFFQREGTVEGSARVDLSFPVSDINDLIKSMVLRDLDGGHISAVSYDSNAPIERTLKSFAINLTGNPAFSDILTQARGEKVEVALNNAGAGAPATLSGTIVGIEKQKQAVGKDTVEQVVLNLWCSDGVRAVKMAEVQRVRFLNPVIDGEFKKALETLALAHDTQKKAVSIRFVGEGKRKVKVGYVIENPIWKTSYRLVLGTKKEEKPYLQGWAVVENPSDEDWKDVRMSLISGRPISFQMDLYQPLYVDRPVVVPELFASLRPVAYTGSLEEEQKQMARLRNAAPRNEQREALGRLNKELRESGEAPPSAGRENRDAYLRPAAKKAEEKPVDLRAGVSTAATAAKLGDFFQYEIDKPVTLNRQKSALLPIVGKDVEGTRVSIYNERTQAKFPLLGLKFKNTSGLHLMQGPITVFEGANYAGDARILDLQPNEERLISYAVDLGTEVDPKPSSDSGKIVHIKAVKGMLWTTTKVRESKTYTVKNRNEQNRTVLIEHPVRHDFTLVDAKPTETASDFHRFQLEVPSGATKTLVVTEEKTFDQALALTTQNDEQIRWFMSQPFTSEKMKAGLQKALDLRLALNKTTREIQELTRQLQTITNDQERLRKNLKEMPPTAAAYKRYLEKFDQQETQIEKYQADIKKLQGEEHAQRKAFEDFLANFSAE